MNVYQLDEARESERVLNLLGRRCASVPLDVAQAIAEAAAERAAIRAEAAPGLVSVPTSDRTTVSASTPFRLRADVQAIREQTGAFVPDPGRSRLSRLRRGIGAAARCLDALKPAVDRVRTVMVTLTYRGDNSDWSPRHISEFLKDVREWLRYREQPFRYVWVAELQKRGVIHYHVAIWLPETLTLPKPDEMGWWPHGMTRIETARHAVPYLMKYLSKGNDAATGSLPVGARSHGRGGLGEQFRSLIRWLSLPAFIQARASVTDRWKRAPGGGWVDPDGEIWPSEFVRRFVGDQWALIRVRDHGRPFSPDGAFSWIRSAPSADTQAQRGSALVGA